MDTKTCTRCEQPLPATREYFSPNPKGVFGLQSRCKRCLAELAAERYRDNPEAGRERTSRWVAAHREEHNARSRDLYAQNPDRGRAYAKKWRENNPKKALACEAAQRVKHHDRILEYGRAYYRDHPERRQESASRWRKAHPYETWSDEAKAAMVAQTRNRRARLQGAPGRHTAADVAAQLERQRGYCYWCGCAVGNGYHVDHVIPLSKGGSNDASNLVISCPHCNTSKNAKHPMEWAGRLC